MIPFDDVHPYSVDSQGRSQDSAHRALIWAPLIRVIVDDQMMLAGEGASSGANYRNSQTFDPKVNMLTRAVLVAVELSDDGIIRKFSRKATGKCS